MIVASLEQIKEADARTIEEFKLNSLVLMEHAAIASVMVIKKKFKGGKCVVLCGKGNNGGDGFAIARLLKSEGFDVCCAFFEDSDLFKSDCRENYNLIKKYGIEEICNITDFEKEVKQCDFTVDCLYGFGFKGSLYGQALEYVKILNDYSKYIYSIDIPSGVSADFSNTSYAVQADETITFTAYKKSAFLFPAAFYYGHITLADIGIDKSLISAKAKIITSPTIEKRKRNVNKSDVGKILVIAGSSTMSGAAYLSSLSALKSGAGLVTLAVPMCISGSLEQKTTEVMTIGLADKNGSFDKSAKYKICDMINNFDAVVFGPGVARNEDIEDILIEILKVCRVPLVIDADGLFALKNCLTYLKDALCEVIITPHSMEMARLCGKDAEYVEQNRFEVCKSFSEDYAVCTVLKGAYTLVCDKSGEIAVNFKTGNPGMATAGSGDVLSGICAAFAANTQSTFEAAKTSVYIHALSGDIAKQSKGEYSLVASDIMQNISEAIKKIELEMYNSER